MTVDPLTPADVNRWRSARLGALLDAPRAFGTTYATAAGWSDAEWEQRVTRLAGDRQAGFLARAGGEDVGMAAGVLSDDEPSRAALISMWVAAAHRGRGVGRLIVARVADWARSRGRTTLCLTVTSNNEAASRFYDRLGFSPTGRVEPYPNDPAVFERELARPL